MPPSCFVGVEEEDSAALLGMPPRFVTPYYAAMKWSFAIQCRHAAVPRTMPAIAARQRLMRREGVREGIWQRMAGKRRTRNGRPYSGRAVTGELAREVHGGTGEVERHTLLPLRNGERGRYTFITAQARGMQTRQPAAATHPRSVVQPARLHVRQTDRDRG